MGWARYRFQSGMGLGTREALRFMSASISNNPFAILQPIRYLRAGGSYRRDD